MEPSYQQSQPPLQPMEPEVNSSPSQQKPKKKKRILLIIFISFIVLALLAVIGAFGWYNYQLQPVSGQEIAVEFTIKSGEGAVAIGDRLESEGLVKSSTAFQLLLRQRGDASKLRTGTYLLSPSLSSQEVADVLVDGKIAQKLVTITPGLRLDEVVKKLEKQGYSQTDIEKALTSNQSALEGIKPADADLEGYLFPETYSVPLDADISDVIARSLDHFKDKLTEETKSQIKAQGLTVHEAVILASIVQQESGNPETQRQIAQVFLKRLNEDIVLGSDVTFIYAAKIAGVRPTVNIDSPYNTRINKGLPPGPISNFNLSALEAVADPADGDYLYFVAGDNGKVYFSKTLQQHEEYVDKYCIELCKL